MRGAGDGEGGVVGDVEAGAGVVGECDGEYGGVVGGEEFADVGVAGEEAE